LTVQYVRTFDNLVSTPVDPSEPSPRTSEM
jgi:hypothetical protein